MLVKRQALSAARRGFTVVELVVLVVFVALLIVVAWTALPRAARPTHGSSPSRKDSTQVRGIVQALTVFAGSNQDKYPLPSLLDRGGPEGLGQTVKSRSATEHAGKDLSRHIYSILIYGGFVPLDMLVSPAEANGNIRVKNDYKFAKPETAADPNDALWDPAFRATGGDHGVGTETAADPTNNSYAHLPPFGQRAKKWSNTFSATEAVIGNRGPQYKLESSSPDAAWVLTDPTETKAANNGTIAGGKASQTLYVHGSRYTWEGNIGYNDNHVSYETKPDPDETPFTFTTPTKRAKPDNLFVNENDADRTPASFFGDYATPGNDNTNNFLILYNTVVTNPTSETDIKLGTWMD
jgi:hypothetical protein